MANQTLYYLCIFALFLITLVNVYVNADSHFEGFEAEEDDEIEDVTIDPASLRSPPLSDPTPQPPPSDLPKSPPSATTTFDFWDDEEFEGVPVENTTPEIPSDPKSHENATATPTPPIPTPPRSFTVEIICGSFLVMFAINYFTGKRENENIALSWAAQFAAKDSIFEKNFSLLGIGDGGDEAPLLLKEGQRKFK